MGIFPFRSAAAFSPSCVNPYRIRSNATFAMLKEDATGEGRGDPSPDRTVHRGSSVARGFD